MPLRAREAGIAALIPDELVHQVVIGAASQPYGLGLTLTAMARSVGQSDLYPFVLSPIVVEKLDFVHGVIATVVSS